MVKYLDDDDLDGNAVVPEGYSLRVPLTLADARRFARFAEKCDAAAHFDPRDHQPHFIQVTTDAVSDARTAAVDARNEMIRRATNAWRTPHRDAAEPDAGSPPGVMRRHLRGTEPDEPEDAQARRNAAWSSYRDRIAGAWKASPNATSGIERQGEQWRHGR